MKKDQAIQFLKHLGVTPPSDQSRSGWVISKCPLMHWRHEGGISSSPTFGIKCEHGDGFVNCYACDFHGKQSELVMEMRTHNKLNPQGVFAFGEALQLITDAENDLHLNLDGPGIEEVLFGDAGGFHEFPEWWLDSFAPALAVPFARQYLAERNVPEALTQALDLRADTSQKRVCFPIRDFQGLLMGLHGRSVEDGVDPRYRMYLQAGKNNPGIWYGEHWIDLTKPVVVVEGPFDVASVKRVYPNVASPLFSNPSEEKLRRMTDAFEWITLLDRGTGGDKGRQKISKVCKNNLVTHLLPPPGVKDPGVMSVEQLRETLGSYVDTSQIIA
jgi:hypothetical protein